MSVADALRRLDSVVRSYPFRAPELGAMEGEVLPAISDLIIALDPRRARLIEIKVRTEEA